MEISIMQTLNNIVKFTTSLQEKVICITHSIKFERSTNINADIKGIKNVLLNYSYKDQLGWSLLFLQEPI